jgi:hypothetical protein
MTTDEGSALAMGGISMTPAPTRLRRVVRVPVWPLRVVSRDTSTRPEVRPVTGTAVPAATVAAPLASPPAAGVRPDVRLGAMPHVSQ